MARAILFSLLCLVASPAAADGGPANVLGSPRSPSLATRDALPRPVTPPEPEPTQGDDATARHGLEVSLGGGGGIASDDPRAFEIGAVPALRGRVMLDLGDARLDGDVTVGDPTRDDRLAVRADGRLLGVMVHDFTWRRSDAGELLRIFAGFGGDITLPESFGTIGFGLGFAMTRLDTTDTQTFESYGGYAGVALRLRVWEIRDELRVAVHAMRGPPDDMMALAMAPESIFDELVVGVTASNRLYVQLLRDGSFSLGPELATHLEMLPEGPLFFATLGVMGTLGI